MDVFLQILDVLLDTGREEERRELSKKKKRNWFSECLIKTYQVHIKTCQ